ncbi:MAG: hypothetical protein MJ117_12150, partial [Lachnospiraceae bacterium]|nr:hypothetical protein [Lachnospiraceae bacterium]
KDTEEKNSKGKALNYWKVLNDLFTDRSGNTAPQQSMWKYVRDIQHDMAARAKWGITDSYEKGEHAPELTIMEGTNLKLKAGERITLHACARNVDGGEVSVNWQIYPEASIGESWKKTILNAENAEADLIISSDAKTGNTIHVVACAEGDGEERLHHYQQIIVTVCA